jgi:transposase-like protein
MSEPKKRKLHTPEYKAKVALEALRSGKTINQIGQEFDVHPVQVGLWKKALQDQAKTLFEGKRGPKPADEQGTLERLYGEIGRLKMDLDWLKRKSGMNPS